VKEVEDYKYFLKDKHKLIQETLNKIQKDGDLVNMKVKQLIDGLLIIFQKRK
jgi:hypothetical protein